MSGSSFWAPHYVLKTKQEVAGSSYSEEHKPETSDNDGGALFQGGENKNSTPGEGFGNQDLEQSWRKLS